MKLIRNILLSMLGVYIFCCIIAQQILAPNQVVTPMVLMIGSTFGVIVTLINRWEKPQV